jgi:D-3-phosphoglycerate dehydrogenase
MSNSTFRVAFSDDFLKDDGALTHPEYDWSPLASDLDIELTYLGATPADIQASQLAELDALILSWPAITPASFGDDNRLALIARSGAGFDNVDLEAATRAGVAVTNTPGGVRRPVAVAILTLVLALAGRLMALERIVRESRWGDTSDEIGVGLVGRTLGSVGMGSIGAELFRLVRPFDMKLIAHDPYADPALAAELGVCLVGLDDVFREADFVNLSVPLMPETRGLVSAERLALMKPTAFLINTSRGPVVDQVALTDALREGRIAGAGIDVFEKEPPDPDDPLLALENVILTPHALCETDQMFHMISAIDCEAVRAVKAGQAPANVVNPAVLESEAFRAKLARLGDQFGGSATK